MSTTRFIGTDRLMLRDDGRTIEGCIVPYGEVAEVVERDPETGDLSRYKEQFLKGSFARMAQGVARRGNASFIKFVLDHDEDSFDAWVGHAVDLRSEDVGAYATFRLYEGRDLMKVRSMLGILSKRYALPLPGLDEVAPQHPTLGDVDSPEALEQYQAAKRAHKAEMRAAAKA